VSLEEREKHKKPKEKHKNLKKELKEYHKKREDLQEIRGGYYGRSQC
jgi:hypothetical protein